MPCQVFPPAKFFFPCNLIRLSLFLSSPLFNAFSARYGSPKRQLQFYRYLPVSLFLSVLSLSFSLLLSVWSVFLCYIFFILLKLTTLICGWTFCLLSFHHISTCWPVCLPCDWPHSVIISIQVLSRCGTLLGIVTVCYNGSHVNGNNSSPAKGEAGKWCCS